EHGHSFDALPVPGSTESRGPSGRLVPYTLPRCRRPRRHEAPAGQGASMTSDREADALSSHLLGIAVGAARDAGSYFKPFAGKIAFAEKKGFFDPVTECDK